MTEYSPLAISIKERLTGPRTLDLKLELPFINPCVHSVAAIGRNAYRNLFTWDWQVIEYLKGYLGCHNVIGEGFDIDPVASGVSDLGYFRRTRYRRGQ